MTINGKEYGFIWSVGARLKYDAWLFRNQNDATVSAAIVQQAIIMSEEYNRINHIDDEPLTMDVILSQPNRVFDELATVVDAQIKLDTEVSVETVAGKKRAAKN